MTVCVTFMCVCASVGIQYFLCSQLNTSSGLLCYFKKRHFSGDYTNASMSQHEAAHAEATTRADTWQKERERETERWPRRFSPRHKHPKVKNTAQPLVPSKGWAAARDAVISFTCKLPSKAFKNLCSFFIIFLKKLCVHFCRQHVGSFDL